MRVGRGEIWKMGELVCVFLSGLEDSVLQIPGGSDHY